VGVYAGRGMGERRAAEEARAVRLPVPSVAEEAPARDGDLTFDETLARGGRGAGDDVVALEERAGADREGAGARAGGQGGERPSGAAADAARQGGAVPDGGAARGRDGDGSPAADARVATAPHGDAAASADAATRTADDGARGATHATDAAAAPARKPETAAAGAHPTDAAGAKPGARQPDARVAVALSPPLGGPTSGQRGIWSVQVTATTDARTADDLVKLLKGHGYDAYIIRAPREGRMFYRVRVGHYPTMETAGQMVTRLRREPGVPEAFVASD